MFRIKLFLTIVINCLVFVAYAKSVTDTAIIRNYLKRAEYFYSKNTDSALYFSSKAINAVQSVDDPDLISQVYKNHGIAFYYKTRYDSAVYYLNIAIKQVPKKETFYLATLYNDYCSALIMYNQFDTALNYLNKSFSINKKLNSKNGLMKNYANYGLIYKSIGAFDIATRYIFQGLPVAEELKDTLAIIKYLQIIGVNYRLMNKPDQGISYYKKALDYSLKIKNYKRVSEIANSIANSYEDLKQYDEAMRHYRLSYDFAYKIGYPTMEAASLVNIGNYYEITNQFDSAMFYLAKGNSLAQKYNYTGIMTAADISYGKIYRKTGQYNKALKHFHRVIDSKDKGESSHMNEAYLQLSELYKSIGNYALAYKYHIIFSQRNDSTLNKQKSEEIANIRMEYELNKKSEQLDAEARLTEAKLQAETARYKFIRNISIVGFLLILIIATLGFISYRSLQNQKFYKLGNELNSYRQRLTAQQMNPHFIFNMLNSIQYFIYNNKKEESMDFISQFAQLMRLNLYNSQNNIITLKDEIEALKLYLELERRRMENKFDFSIEIDPSIDMEKQFVPSFLIQPIIENSIKHGITPIEHKGNIRTSIIRNNENLIYSIVDNGIGFKRSKTNHGDAGHISYGLELTKKRISLIGMLNNKKTEFTFTDIYEKEGDCIGTKVEMVIPYSLRSI